ncbi:MAG TPA: hypothetical protein VIY29_15820, partial [Ktedonobacteraceae bacterium]
GFAPGNANSLLLSKYHYCSMFYLPFSPQYIAKRCQRHRPIGQGISIIPGDRRGRFTVPSAD